MAMRFGLSFFVVLFSRFLNANVWKAFIIYNAKPNNLNQIQIRFNIKSIKED